MAIAEPPGREARGGLQIIHKDEWMPREFERAIRHWTPQTDLGAVAMRIIAGPWHLPLELKRELFEHVRKAVVIESQLELTVFRSWDNPEAYRGLVEYLGVASRKVITDAGVALIVDALDNTLADATIKFHGIGTGTNAEAAADTALQTELTTEYNPNSTRATGTFSQPSANISRSVATNTVDATAGVTEHGVLSQAATGGGTLLDRSVFSVVNLVSGDSLQSTYSVTFTSGG